ncbi:uncharacterized protein LOC106131085 isoform X1 [Amyelois transitella]|uniref:uncharacterized protein LOC106131085 isoform X1 n=1 Tax=Amyelois transitella TaxID=680683 RepID=UPI0029901B1B|nr:uncharacterized protein LOC106131085 isoform X1 [Amyelois transitella]
MFIAFEKKYKNNFTMLNTMQYMTFLQWIMCLCTVSNIRFINNEENVNFFLKMHQIDRLMKIDTNKFIMSTVYKRNRNTVLILLIAYLVLCTMIILDDVLFFMTSFGIMYVQMTHMIEVLNFSCLMYYFTLRLKFVNSIILNHIKPEFVAERFPSSLNMQHMMVLRKLAADTHDFAYCDLDVYLREFLYGFYKFQELYQFQVLIAFLKMFVNSAVYLHFIIIALKDNTLRLIDTVMTIILYITDCLLIALACIRSESFYREAKLTKHLSISTLSIYDDGPLRYKTKRLLKILEENPPVFSVYHMWNLKADTMVKLTGVLTTVFFTLLQFHYL